MIDYNFKELVRILTKIDTSIRLLMPYKCTKFQPDQSTHLQVMADFAICAKRRRRRRRKKRRTKRRTKTETLVSRILETPGVIYFNFGIQPPLIGGQFHSKFGDLLVKGHESMNA